MVFIIALLFFIFAFNPEPTLAYSNNGSSLYYQLIEAYKPISGSSYLNSPSYTSNNVLGVSTTNAPTPTSTPVNIGGGDEENMVIIAVLGDSMIDTLGQGIPQLQKSLSSYYPHKKIKILNYGVGASTMEYALNRLTNNYQYLGKTVSSLVSQLPDVVIIESFAYNNFGNTQAGFDKQTSLITNIISTIHDKLPKANVLLTSTFAPNSLVFANGSEYQFTSLEKAERTTTIKNYLQNFYNYAQDRHIPFADAYHPSLTQNEGDRVFINTKDNIHPSTYGGEFFCDTVAKALFDNRLIP